MMIASRLSLAADEDLTEPVADFVDALCRQAGLAPRQAYRLRLAVDEVTTNVALHGYHDCCGVLDLEGGITIDRVWVSVEDDAGAFDPTGHDPAPRLAEGLMAHQAGGYGLFLAMSSVDEFTYGRVGGRNRNTLIVMRDASGEGFGEMKGGDDAEDAGLGRR